MTIELGTPPVVEGGRIGRYPSTTPQNLDEAVSWLKSTASTRADEKILEYAIKAIVKYATESVELSQVYTAPVVDYIANTTVSTVSGANGETVTLTTTIEEIATETPAPDVKPKAGRGKAKKNAESGGPSDDAQSTEQVTVTVIEDFENVIEDFE